MLIVLIVIIQVLLRSDRCSALCSSATFQPAEGDLHPLQQVDPDHFTTDRLVAPKLQPWVCRSSLQGYIMYIYTWSH